MSIDVNVQNDLVIVTESSEDITVNVSNAAGPQGPAGANGVGVPVGGSTGQVLKKFTNSNYDTYWASDASGLTSIGLSMPSAFAVSNSPLTSNGTLAVTGAGDTTQYIAGDGSLVAFPIAGQAGTLVREVRNVTGATLTKGTVVYINGASGNKPTVTKALATGDSTSAQTFGIVQANIANNSNGFVVAVGDIDGLDTSAFADGAQLYLSATVAGTFTDVKQYAPNHLVYIGVVTRSHVNQGRIEVRIQNGYELDEIHNVAAQTPSNNDALIYESSTSLWKNKTIATALGYTPQATLTLTTTGTSGAATLVGATLNIPQYSGGGSMAIGGAITSATVGSVLFAGTSGVLQQDNSNLFWDDTNNRLGIGTNAPSARLQVSGNTLVENSYNGATTLSITNAFNGTDSSANLILNSNAASGSAQVFKYASGRSSYKFITASDFGHYNGTVGGDISFLNDFSTGKIKFGAGGSSTAQMTLTAAGRLLLGTTIESTFLADINGTARVGGALTAGSVSTGAVTGTTANFSGNAAFGSTTQIAIGGSGGFGGGANYWLQAVSNNFTINVTANAASSVEFIASGSPLNSYTGYNNALSQRNVTMGYSAGLTGYYNQYKSVLNATGNASANTMYVRGYFVDSGTLTPNSTTIIPIGFENVSGSNLFNSTSGSTLFGGQYASLVASAKVQIDSSTQGFLPPRMTNAQRTAISSPAVGLIVYCTDATEGLYEYTSAGWVNLNGIVTNRQTASYTLALTDVNDLVEMNVATANNLTVPLNSVIAFPIGTKIDIAQYGAGQTTVVATGGVTIRSAGGALKLAAQYSGATLVKIGTDEWYLFGDITV